MGGGVIRAADSYHLFFSAMPNVVQYVGHRPAHILVYNRQGRQGVYTGWTKKFEKISTFHHFETLRPYISETIKNR